ncbi:response regulator [Psychrosphaera sp. F3M07]|jgi:two-component system chemotaxis response regulator CheY|uniref:response regulator n=1 Tax=Psychrosphaera sp. F3M07 TaxID=2841560 RepID=UPI001C08ACFA|nr:response regulator [Psychrosphaera sp. F3M07]MBU2917824.1 response regulator [Psychrosphaera sp. F3M07]
MSELTPADLSILLVEPSTTQQKIIVNLLKTENITHIQLANNIESALASIKLSAPDLVASAMHFTDGTALDLVKLLKNDPMTEDVPFMLVSSEHRKEQLEEFRQSGVVAILPKPFNHDHLAKAINSTLDLLTANELELNFFDVHSIRVLVVDDSKMARNFVSRVLRSLGIERITEAADGAEAISIIKDNMFDLVVTDYNMPEVNGQELTEYIRKESEQSHIPVLMVSSEANEAHLSNIEQSGVNAMCDKPFEPENVRRILFRLFEGEED